MKALIVNCTLKASPEKSNTEGKPILAMNAHEA